jgi:hypothetical protein
VRASSTTLCPQEPSVVSADDSTLTKEGVAAIIRQDLGCTEIIKIEESVKFDKGE